MTYKFSCLIVRSSRHISLCDDDNSYPHAVTRDQAYMHVRGQCLSINMYENEFAYTYIETISKAQTQMGCCIYLNMCVINSSCYAATLVFNVCPLQQLFSRNAKALSIILIDAIMTGNYCIRDDLQDWEELLEGTIRGQFSSALTVHLEAMLRLTSAFERVLKPLATALNPSEWPKESLIIVPAESKHKNSNNTGGSNTPTNRQIQSNHTADKINHDNASKLRIHIDHNHTSAEDASSQTTEVVDYSLEPSPNTSTMSGNGSKRAAHGNGPSLHQDHQVRACILLPPIETCVVGSVVGCTLQENGRLPNSVCVYEVGHVEQADGTIFLHLTE
jgi:hypothetical protein